MLRLFAALAFAAGVAAFPGAALDAAREAMTVWAERVAPAMFPFVAVMPYLTCEEARRVYDKLLGGAVRRLFALPGGCASAIITGLVAGSPAGALAAARVAAQEKLTRGQAERLAGMVCGASPAFALTGMGVALAGSADVGWRLAVSQLAGQLVTGILFRNAFLGNKAPVEVGDVSIDKNPVSAAVVAVLRVCGYMVMFSVGISVAHEMLGEWVVLVTPVMDLPGGAVVCAELELPYEIWAAALGFGGICILGQNLGVLRAIGVRAWTLVLQKMACSAVCAGVCFVLGKVKKPVFDAGSMLNGYEFELTLLVLMVFLAPVTLFFVRKSVKKHIS